MKGELVFKELAKDGSEVMNASKVANNVMDRPTTSLGIS